jgi:hypothetical protein
VIAALHALTRAAEFVALQLFFWLVIAPLLVLTRKSDFTW